jgi:hypothetical protein
MESLLQESIPKDGVVYVIVNGENYVELLAKPATSIFISTFDKMLSTFRFITP